MQNTLEQYDNIIKNCRSLFLEKTEDYGTAWRILRVSSLTDQIFIKAQRIRTIQDKGKALVEEGVDDEFTGIINYCAIALIQIELCNEKALELSAETVMKYYDEILKRNRSLLEKKNHDYGEAWRDMRLSSLTDLILMKLLRIKQIEDNQGNTKVSEGIDANYQDMLNYAVFSLIKLNTK